ncbi:EGF-like domain-containing protein [Ditylenchus destructor]|nr:EGF-like domain-containing protein [Ditylenchus destructor]
MLRRTMPKQCNMPNHSRGKIRMCLFCGFCRCEVNIDDCINNKCANGASCIDKINSYECICPRMFAGRYCEQKLSFCSELLNPCENGATCVPKSHDTYECACAPGFSGQNCSINMDDCQQHECEHGGICIDGINSYTCQCPLGFYGEHCEMTAPATSLGFPTNRLYRNIAGRCSPSNCENGFCAQTPSSQDNDIDDKMEQCQCFHGYGGTGCRMQLSFRSGVIAYYGDREFVALELFDGRIKAAFYVGNYPSSHMYSYNIVNDGLPHKLSVLIRGKQLSLIVDDGKAQNVINSGKISTFEVKSRQRLYLGGLPKDVAQKALTGFHLKQGHSLQGCIESVYVNGDLQDLKVQEVVEHRDTTPGCAATVNLCADVDLCSGHGSCYVNTSLADGIECKCDNGFVGQRCSKKKYRGYHEEGTCRSIEVIKNARCVGWCGSDSVSSSDVEGCCAPVKTKRRRVKMVCRDGNTKIGFVDIIRKCSCLNDCSDSMPITVS